MAWDVPAFFFPIVRIRIAIATKATNQPHNFFMDLTALHMFDAVANHERTQHCYQDAGLMLIDLDESRSRNY